MRCDLDKVVGVRQTFPQQKSQFHVISMTEKDVQIQDESQDVVLSLGAFAMYLYKDEMEIALKEALRMAKMGGRLCFTHFLPLFSCSCWTGYIASFC